MASQFSQPARQLEHGMYNVIPGGGAGGGGGGNQAIFSNNPQSAKKNIDADEKAAIAAVAFESQEEANKTVDSQVQDLTAATPAEAAYEAAVEAAAHEEEAETAAEVELEGREAAAEVELEGQEVIAEVAAGAGPGPMRSRIRALSERAAQARQTLLDIAKEKETEKERKLHRVCVREQAKELRKAEAARAAGAGVMPAGVVTAQMTPTGHTLSRQGTAAYQVPNQFSCARRLAEAARAGNDESLRVLFSGISDKSALDQLWRPDENECCYLCGFPTHIGGSFPDGNHTLKLVYGNRSPEHVIPMTAGGAAYIGILKARDDINGPGNENLRNLLRKELRPAHYWCNEIKANMLFITWPTGGQITFNRTVVSNFLYFLYYGSSTGTRFYDEDYCKVYCQQNNKLYPHLVHYFCKTRGITFDDWHAQSILRIRSIIEDISSTIHNVLAPGDTYTVVKTRFDTKAAVHWGLGGKPITPTPNICYTGVNLGRFTNYNLPDSEKRAPPVAAAPAAAAPAAAAPAGGGGLHPAQRYSVHGGHNVYRQEGWHPFKGGLRLRHTAGYGTGYNGDRNQKNRSRSPSHRLPYEKDKKLRFLKRTRKHRPRKTRKRNRKQRKTRKV